jgi:thymidine kinase
MTEIIADLTEAPVTRETFSDIGWIVAVAGSMFAKKSTHLVNLYERWMREGHECQFFNTTADNRYSGGNFIVTHDD